MSEWRPIPGWEGYYEVSDQGEVRSLDRLNARNQRIAGRTLTPFLNTDGYPRVDLFRQGVRTVANLHRVVMLAFVGPCPADQEVLHGDGDRGNPRLSNLSYGTRRENTRDTVRHGHNVNAAKTHCLRGHEFTPENTRVNVNGSRECRPCQAINRQRRLDARLAS